MSDGGLLIPKQFQEEIADRVNHTTLHYDTEYDIRVYVYNPTGKRIIRKSKPWWKFWEPQHYLIKAKESNG